MPRDGRPSWAVAAKEARDILRERTILAALFVQLLVAAFSTVLVVGLSVLWAPGAVTVDTQSAIAYVGPGGFDQVLEEEGLRLVRPDADEAARLLDIGRVVALVEERDAGGTRHVTIHVTEGSLAAVATMPALREALQEYEQRLRDAQASRLATPVLEVPDAPSGAIPSGFIIGVLLPMLILVPAFLSGAVAGDSWVRERQTGTMTLLRASPATARDIVEGKMAVPLVLAPLQSAAWLGILALGGTPVHNVPLLLALSFILAAYLAGLGILVAATAHSTVTSQTAYAVLVLASVAASLFLPRDLLNTIALIASDNVLAEALATVLVLAVAAAIAVGAGLWSARRSVARDA